MDAETTAQQRMKLVENIWPALNNLNLGGYK
jgi:hypothetical protein